MREPTSDECSRRAKVTLTEGMAGWACWYPQMGGYTGKAVAVNDHECINVYVWHDGQFPFGDPDDYGQPREPVKLHHCDPDQFVGFGNFLAEVATGEVQERSLPMRRLRPGLFLAAPEATS